MQERFNELLKNAKIDIENLVDTKLFAEVKAKYLGKNGEITALLKGMKDVAPEERSSFGKMVNDLKVEVSTLFDEKEQNLKNAEVLKKFEEEKVDITLPGKKEKIGSLHPLNIVLNQIIDAFCGMGFKVFEGPEIDSDYYCFQALNIPKDHPARDMQDTFWLENGQLLKTHTSAAQNRIMRKYGAPLKAIFPGRCFRNEDLDASHENTFFQLEGIDRKSVV